MKIAFVTSYLSRRGGGGIVTAVEALSAALADRGNDVHVLGLADEEWKSEKSDWSGAPVRAFEVRGPKALGRSHGLRRALLSGGFEVVHSHGMWMHPSANVVAWASQTGRPYVVAPHGMMDSWALALSPIKKRIARLLYEDRHLGGAACFQALCRPEAEAIKAFGIQQRVRIIPNGVDIPHARPLGDPPWSKEFGRNARVLLFLGRLHPKKNIDNLLDALGILQRTGALQDWKLAIAGWDQAGHQADLVAAAAKAGLGDVVAFLGPLQGIAKSQALYNASAFVLPSRSEGLPMAVLEAWAHRLPVAMTKACNLEEAFEIGAAFKIDTSGSAMADQLLKFLRMTDSELELMGSRGFELAVAHYTWPAVAAQLEELYSEFVDVTDKQDIIAFAGR